MNVDKTMSDGCEIDDEKVAWMVGEFLSECGGFKDEEILLASRLLMSDPDMMQRFNFLDRLKFIETIRGWVKNQHRF